MPIEFDDSLRTGIELVDEQHATLVTINNELEAALKKGQAHRHMAETLARLFQYAKLHFEAEEKLFTAAEYVDLAQHQLEHKRLLQKLKKFIVRYRNADERISAEMVEFVRTWVVHHIKETDFGYVEAVKSHLAEHPESLDVT